MQALTTRCRGKSPSKPGNMAQPEGLAQLASCTSQAQTKNVVVPCETRHRVSGLVQLDCISSSISAILALTGDKPREWGNSELSAGIIRPLGQRVARTTLIP